ncbi:aldo/keto reductase [Streptomyces sp. NPDC007369]|uniref:aldo/keto reductase n=1 Tax=Streptomyces sp. NPDC007369 TaxID=3154589 RepID=UPI00340CC507
MSAIGLGCMGMSEFYGPGDEAESVATIRAALDAGVTLVDTADMYGPFTNEELVGRAVAGRRQEVFLATKVGVVRGADPRARSVDSTPAHVRSACEASLRRLGVEHVDLLYLHRRDPRVPVQDTVGAMAGLVEEGKVRYLGLSEVSADTLRQACEAAPISALQSEYSLFTRGLEHAVLPAARALGVAVVAYSPLGRGLLTGRMSAEAVGGLDPGDIRRSHPRFRADHLRPNLARVERLRAVAASAGATPAQAALAWLLAQGPDVIPLPGTRRRDHLAENLGAVRLQLSAARLAALRTRVGEASGRRAPDLSRLEQ